MAHIKLGATSSFPEAQAPINPDARFMTNYQPGLVLSKSFVLLKYWLSNLNNRSAQDGHASKCSNWVERRGSDSRSGAPRLIATSHELKCTRQSGLVPHCRNAWNELRNGHSNCTKWRQPCRCHGKQGWVLVGAQANIAVKEVAEASDWVCWRQ